MVDVISMLRQFIIMITKNRCCMWLDYDMNASICCTQFGIWTYMSHICTRLLLSCVLLWLGTRQCAQIFRFASLQWRHNERIGVSNHQPPDWLLNCLFKASKKTSKLRVTGLCAGDWPVDGEFPAQMANNAENVSIWWRHHVTGTRN